MTLLLYQTARSRNNVLNLWYGAALKLPVVGNRSFTASQSAYRCVKKVEGVAFG
jgi:hypothetical protein